MKKNNVLFLIIKIYILSISIFFIFRLLLFLTEMHRLVFSKETIYDVFSAFIMGMRFDIVITGYIMLLPALILFIKAILNYKNQFIDKLIYYWILILFIIAFVINAADIPYFNQFFSRFSVGAFEWIDSPVFVFKMIIQEPKYVLAFIPFLILSYLYYRGLKKIFTYDYLCLNANLYLKIIIALFTLFLIFLGIRGRIAQKSPIRVGTAYFCQNPFLNQLGLNPVFTFVKSYLISINEKNKPIQLIDNKTAIKNVQKYLNIKKAEYKSPIARKIEYDSSQLNKPNVIIIIMESMSAAKMKRHGNKDNLTPFLDSLSYQSYYFEHIYSAGMHTFNGIFATLFSFPALYRQHPLKAMKKYMGIATTLKNIGYSTTYFTTHDGQFDNVAGFLRANDFENIISQSDYPLNEVKTTLGVPDDYMFRYSIPLINKLYKQGKPFFVAFMTASDHGPYYLPEYFHPKTHKIKKQIVEYADWSLKQFIKLASKTDWFDNTIFVFIADHGAALNVNYDIALNYHHEPLIIYAPKILHPKLFSKIGGQIDVFPTIMGILKQSYINNTLGIDLIHENRPYIFINADDKVGVLDNKFFLILKKSGDKALYKYNNLDKTNYILNYKEKADSMETYLKSNLQVYQYMLLNDSLLP